jgi:hypothetical protein
MTHGTCVALALITQLEQPKSFVHCVHGHQLHVPIALEAIKNAKHVCARGNGHDKPLVDSEGAARDLVQPAAKQPVWSMRFCLNECRRIKALIEAKHGWQNDYFTGKCAVALDPLCPGHALPG